MNLTLNRFSKRQWMKYLRREMSQVGSSFDRWYPTRWPGWVLSELDRVRVESSRVIFESDSDLSKHILPCQVWRSDLSLLRRSIFISTIYLYLATFDQSLDYPSSITLPATLIDHLIDHSYRSHIIFIDHLYRSPLSIIEWSLSKRRNISHVIMIVFMIVFL
jgi:hypothetical protein